MKSWLIWKDPDGGKDWRQEEKGPTEDEVVGWHLQLNQHEFGWTPGVGDGQGGLVCCGSWGHQESDMTEWLNWTETEAEDIKKKWQEYTVELYKRDLLDPDNHNDVITHLEPDILECEVKWVLGSITTNKAGGDGIPAELFQILKDDAVKVLHSI